jgi:hypothetical protein
VSPILVFFLCLVSFIGGFLISWAAQARKLTQHQPTPEVQELKEELKQDLKGGQMKVLPRGEVRPRIIRTLHEDCICGAKPDQWCLQGCAALDPWDYR